MFWPQGGKSRPNHCRHSCKNCSSISKNCNFNDVTAEEYRKELARDAFINGLSSRTIRQRLLENYRLTLDQAFDIASSMSMAMEHSAGYLSGESFSALPVALQWPRLLACLMMRTIPARSGECNFCGSLQWASPMSCSWRSPLLVWQKRSLFTCVSVAGLAQLEASQTGKPVVRCLYWELPYS